MRRVKFEPIHLDIKVAEIKEKIDLTGLNTIYGIPSGGVTFAMALGKTLGLTYVSKDDISESTLICDDIMDS